MKSFSAIALLFFAVIFAFSVSAQEQPSWEVKALSEVMPGTVEGEVDYDLSAGTATATNGIYVKYDRTTLTADNASLNTQTGQIVADGHVRIESGDELWVGDHITYNFKTRKMTSEQFRTGKYPIFAGGDGLTADVSNRVYTATNAYVTTDDSA
ncbi:MAG TPA: hypothetical protein VFF11_13645, partial [Candidatus Binatia bacterium]|nr:hypothetical protein [Candidatus Binatia bacterium]